MKVKEIRFLELPANEYENAKRKNDFISGQCSGEYIGFINSDATNKKEICALLEEPYLAEKEMVLFAENAPEGEMNLITALSSFDMKIFAYVFPKKMLTETGCFNERLADGNTYELLCRLAEENDIYCVACADEADREETVSSGRVRCCAYIMRRYMTKLKNAGMLDFVFGRLSAYMERYGADGQQFGAEMNRMLSDKKAFADIDSNTAPFLVISGNDMCHGVLKDFAAGIAQALADMGQAVTTTDGAFGKYTGAGFAAERTLKGIIGFQAPVLEKEFFREIAAPKFQFWFDNPVFFDDLLHDLPDNYCILCQDGYYARFIREFYHTRNALAFPPAGRKAERAEDGEREYDVSFIGTYRQPNLHCAADDFGRAFWEYMLNNPAKTFEEGLSGLLCERQIDVPREQYPDILKALADVCRNVIYYFRHKAVETILDAGIELHVFGDTWESYRGAGRENMVIHPFVTVEESLEVFAKSKIGFNIMTWHKAGMTERIANIMLSGAVCVSDETTALREYFREDEEIILFRLERLDELPVKINKLLKEREYRENIGKRGCQKASVEHVWKKRAEQLLRLLQSEEIE